MIYQFIGFLFFTSIASSGFWCFIIFIKIIPYWIIMGTAEIYGKLSIESDTEIIRKKILSETKGVKIIYNT